MHYSNCFTSINSFKTHSNPMNWGNEKHSYFTDKNTKMQQC